MITTQIGNTIFSRNIGAADHLQYLVDKNDYGLLDIYCMIQIGVNSMVNKYIMDLIKELRKTPEYLKKGVKGDLLLIERDYAFYIRRLNASLEKYAKKSGKNDLDLKCQIADMADCSDELVAPIMEDARTYFQKKMPKFGDCSPREPKIFEDLMLANVACAIGSMLFKKAVECNPKYMGNVSMAYLNPKIFDNRIYKLTSKLFDQVLKNKNGTQLVIKTYKMWDTPEMQGKEVGVNLEGGILPRLRDAFYSTVYIDKMYIIRDGRDMHFRDMADSLFTTLHKSKDIAI